MYCGVEQAAMGIDRTQLGREHDGHLAKLSVFLFHLQLREREFDSKDELF